MVQFYSQLTKISYTCLKLIHFFFQPFLTYFWEFTFNSVNLSKSKSIKTVDQDEVEKFNNISTFWWNKNGSLKGLHSMNHLRVPFIRDGLISSGIIPKSKINSPNVLENIKILDVGCGGGILSEALGKLHAQVTGLDPGVDLLKVAKAHLALDKDLESRVEYVAETIEDHAKANVEKYDVVVISEVIEHVTEKEEFVEACIKALKPGGSIFVTTFNRTMLSWLFGIIFAEYILGLVPKGTHSWDKFISPDDLKILLKKQNCNVTLVRGINYEFWHNQWEWIDYLDVNFAIHAIKKE